MPPHGCYRARWTTTSAGARRRYYCDRRMTKWIVAAPHGYYCDRRLTTRLVAPPHGYYRGQGTTSHQTRRGRRRDRPNRSGDSLRGRGCRLSIAP
jgi:hypothetical protein